MFRFFWVFRTSHTEFSPLILNLCWILFWAGTTFKEGNEHKRGHGAVRATFIPETNFGASFGGGSIETSRGGEGTRAVQLPTHLPVPVRGFRPGGATPERARGLEHRHGGVPSMGTSRARGPFAGWGDRLDGDLVSSPAGWEGP